MSPTEFDLRAALRDGEGDGVDPDEVISQGRARQAQRRTRIMSTAAVVAVVAAAGIGGAVLWNDDGARTSTADRARSARAANGDALHAESGSIAGSASAPAAAGSSVAAGAERTRGKGASAAGVPCPDSLPRLALPGGGSPGQFGADGPLFAKPVASLVVCSYGSPLTASEPGLAVPARLVLSGAQAKVLVDSMEQADTTKGITGCPRLRNLSQRELAIIPVATDGTRLPTVTTTLSDPACDVRVTNGTALRYNWKPPQDLQQLLISLTPRRGQVSVSVPQVSPSGKNHGSPIQS